MDWAWVWAAAASRANGSAPRGEGDLNLSNGHRDSEYIIMSGDLIVRAGPPCQARLSQHVCVLSKWSLTKFGRSEPRVIHKTDPGMGTRSPFLCPTQGPSV